MDTYRVFVRLLSPLTQTRSSVPCFMMLWLQLGKPSPSLLWFLDRSCLLGKQEKNWKMVGWQRELLFCLCLLSYQLYLIKGPTTRGSSWFLLCIGVSFHLIPTLPEWSSCHPLLRDAGFSLQDLTQPLKASASAMEGPFSKV